MDLELNGKVAAVAAGSRGIGRAIALVLKREGASVSICGRDRESLERTRSELDAISSSGSIAIKADLCVAEDVTHFVDETVRELKGLDILVCNAGGPRSGRFEDLEEKDFVDAFHLTLLSAVRLCRAALPHLKQSTQGRIVTVTSVSVKQPLDGLLLSNALRTGVLGFLKTLSNEMGSSGITVNAVCPGFTRTKRLQQLLSERGKREGRPEEELILDIEKQIPLQRLAEPEEIADAVAFLVSSRASYITGTALAVDGGFTRGLS